MTEMSWDISKALNALCQKYPQCRCALQSSINKEIWTNGRRRKVLHLLCKLLLNSFEIFQDIVNFFRPLIVPLLAECENILKELDHTEFERFVVYLSLLIFEFPVLKSFAEIYNLKYPNLLQRFKNDAILMEPEKKVPKLDERKVVDAAILDSLYRYYLSNVCYYRTVWDWTVLIQLCRSPDPVLSSLSRQCLFLLFECSPSLMFSSYELEDDPVSHRFNLLEQVLSIDFSKNLTFPVSDGFLKKECFAAEDFKNSSHLHGKFLPKIFVQSATVSKIPITFYCTESRRIVISEMLQSLLYPAPIIVKGPISSGKTSILDYLSQACNAEALKIQMSDQIDLKILLGGYHCSHIPGKFNWITGPLTKAVSKGYWLIMEDFDCCPPDIMAFMSLLFESNELRPGGPIDSLPVHPNFRLILTIRTERRKNNPSFDSFVTSLRRYAEINVDKFGRKELEQIVENLYPVFDGFTNKLLDAYQCLQDSTLPTVNHSDMQHHLGLRDLMKCCKRLSKYMNLNDSENVRNAFKDLYDCMIAFDSSAVDRQAMVKTVSPIFVLSYNEAEILLNGNPKVELSERQFRCGRVLLDRFPKENNEKKFKRPVFARIGQTRRLLESVAACIEMNEPVLLRGETGVGKTSVIQYFAYAMRAKLVVINMNQQSDIADLLGGYKPLDLTSYGKSLWAEFYDLFTKTFSLSKNEKFIEKLKVSFLEKKWRILCSAMQHPIKYGLRKCSGKPDLTERWNRFQKHTDEFLTQINHSALMFDFVEGTLSKAIKDGFWVLLDEINLATPEVLQILCGLLEDTHASVTLSERGDSEPLSRSPNFRIFACMNPSTDVGKRDLPASIRNRFTEFFVDEPTSDDDLLKIIESYMILSKDVSKSIIEVYKEIRSMSKVSSCCYSLRSLCRAMMYAKDSKYENVMRSIYEGLSMCFVTPAPNKVQSMVNEVVIRHLKPLCNLTSIIKSPLKCPGKPKQYVNVEGFWLKLGDSPVVTREDYVFTATVRQHLKALSRIVSYRRLPVLIQGDTSVGKTSLIQWLAGVTGNNLVRINNHEHTDIQEYIGSYYPDENGNLVFSLGALAIAMQRGDWIVLDELNLAPTDVLEALNRVLDDNRELFIPETQQVIHAHPNFMLFATQNPPGIYAGRKTLSRAFRNRFIELHFEQLPITELEEILETKCKLPPSYASKMVSVLAELLNLRASSFIFHGKYGLMTLRDLFKWGDRYTKTKFEHPDWLRFMAESGYLLLSSRVRNSEDMLIVQKVIEDKFKMKIDEEELFSFKSDTTKYFSYVLSNDLPNEFKHIVWTRQMRRIALLCEMCHFYDEPALLIGETGCGKTTICQILSYIHSKPLYTINCHMLTETAEFLGSLRPVRNELDKQNDKLFEWVDGPLINALKMGGIFLMDEISLADDSVLERLNSVLDPDRCLLLAEKAGTGKSVVNAAPGFRMYATMNPGGDYGKKELSPALRNRFTEIWCLSCRAAEEMFQILSNTLNVEARTDEIIHTIIKFMTIIYDKHPSVHFTTSTRDLIIWVQFINACLSNEYCSLHANEACFHGAHLVFLDAFDKRKFSKNFLDELNNILIEGLNFVENNTSSFHSLPLLDSDRFGFDPFYINTGSMKNELPLSSKYAFSRKSTLNLKKILRAMQVNKPILLEGPPGVGKTSVVDALARMSGNCLIRINLSDQTDICDLFGTDLPAENGLPGEFEWKDGPLLFALKNGYWILLDEVNLASQSVLEGLNACLDHRGEVFVAELNRVFKIRSNDTKIFATQNPHEDGCGRKGLPKSFINRFTTIFLESLDEEDILAISSLLHSKINLNCLKNMITFLKQLNAMSSSDQFSTFVQFNLRDMFRWCELVENRYSLENSAYLIFVARMRCLEDQAKVENKFLEIFDRKIIRPSRKFYMTSDILTVGQVSFRRQKMLTVDWDMCIYPTMVHYLELILMCIKENWLTILVGEAGSGKLSTIQAAAAMIGKKLFVIPLNAISDTSDLLGSFEQENLSARISSQFRELASILQEYIRRALNGITQLSATSLNLLNAACHCLIVLSSTESVDSKLHEIRSVLKLCHDVTLSSALKSSLTRICEMQVSSHRYDNKFTWRDSVLMNALLYGHWVVLADANKCNAAILDRLNCLMEPNGSLMITERGTTEGNISLVKPHPDFRAFITMDPLYGEISDAMRNRGVEISFIKETSTDIYADLMPVIQCAASESLSSEVTRYVSFLRESQLSKDLAKVKHVWVKYAQSALACISPKSFCELWKENRPCNIHESSTVDVSNEVISDNLTLGCETVFFRCNAIMNIQEISLLRNVWFLYRMSFNNAHPKEVLIPFALGLERISLKGLNQFLIRLRSDTLGLLVHNCITAEILTSKCFHDLLTNLSRNTESDSLSFYPMDVRVFIDKTSYSNDLEIDGAAIDRFLVFTRWKLGLLIRNIAFDMRESTPKFSSVEKSLLNSIAEIVPILDEFIQDSNEKWNPAEVCFSFEWIYQLIDAINSHFDTEKMHAIWYLTKRDLYPLLYNSTNAMKSLNTLTDPLQNIDNLLSCQNSDDIDKYAKLRNILFPTKGFENETNALRYKAECNIMKFLFIPRNHAESILSAHALINDSFGIKLRTLLQSFDAGSCDSIKELIMKLERNVDFHLYGQGRERIVDMCLLIYRRVFEYCSCITLNDPHHFTSSETKSLAFFLNFNSFILSYFLRRLNFVSFFHLETFNVSTPVHFSCFDATYSLFISDVIINSPALIYSSSYQVGRTSLTKNILTIAKLLSYNVMQMQLNAVFEDLMQKFTLSKNNELVEVSANSECFDFACAQTSDEMKLDFIITCGALLCSKLQYPCFIDPVRRAEYSVFCLTENIESINREMSFRSSVHIVETGSSEGFYHPWMKSTLAKVESAEALVNRLGSEIYYRDSHDMFARLVSSLRNFIKTIFDPTRIRKISDEMKSRSECAISMYRSWLLSVENFLFQMHEDYFIYADIIEPFSYAISTVLIGFEHMYHHYLTVKVDPTCLIAVASWPKRLSAYDFLMDAEQMFQGCSTVKIDRSLFLLLNLWALNEKSKFGISRHNDVFFASLFKLLNFIINEWMYLNQNEKLMHEKNTAEFRYISVDSSEINETKVNEIFPSYTIEFDDMEQSTITSVDVNSNDSCQYDSILSSDYIHDLFMLCANVIFESQNEICCVSDVADIMSKSVHALLTAQASCFDFSVNSHITGCFILKLKKHFVGKSSEDYNFYTDSNVIESARCIEPLKKMKSYVNEQLLPKAEDHPVLKEILKIIDHILSLPYNSPVVKFLSGLDLLVEKCQPWETVAPKVYSLSKYVDEIASIIVSWRDMELKCWKATLHFYEKEVIKKNLFMFWPHVYNVLNEMNVLLADTKEKLVDEILKRVEILKQFLLNSNLGEFAVRMKILKVSYGLLTNFQNKRDRNELWKQYVSNTLSYFQFFAEHIEKVLIDVKAPIEKQLEESVKIASWSKMNYYSLKETSMKNKRTVLKHLHKFREALSQPVLSFFVKPTIDLNLPLLLSDENAFFQCNLLQISDCLRCEEKTLLAKAKYHTLSLLKQNKLSEFSEELSNLYDLTQSSASLLNKSLTFAKDDEDEMKKKLSRSLITQRKNSVFHLLKTLKSLGISGQSTVNNYVKLSVCNPSFSRTSSSDIKQLWTLSEQWFWFSWIKREEIMNLKPHTDVKPALYSVLLSVIENFLSALIRQRKSLSYAFDFLTETESTIQRQADVSAGYVVDEGLGRQLIVEVISLTVDVILFLDQVDALDMELNFDKDTRVTLMALRDQLACLTESPSISVCTIKKLRSVELWAIINRLNDVVNKKFSLLEFMTGPMNDIKHKADTLLQEIHRSEIKIICSAPVESREEIDDKIFHTILLRIQHIIRWKTENDCFSLSNIIPPFGLIEHLRTLPSNLKLHQNTIDAITLLVNLYRTYAHRSLLLWLKTTRLFCSVSILLANLIQLGFQYGIALDDPEDGNENFSLQIDTGIGMDENEVGMNDVSDQIEFENQIEGLKNEKNNEDANENIKNEENGIEMSEDIEAPLQDDIEKQDDNVQEDDEKDESNVDDQMGKVEFDEGEQLDKEIWSDEDFNDDPLQNSEEPSNSKNKKKSGDLRPNEEEISMSDFNDYPDMVDDSAEFESQKDEQIPSDETELDIPGDLNLDEKDDRAEDDGVTNFETEVDEDVESIEAQSQDEESIADVEMENGNTDMISDEVNATSTDEMECKDFGNEKPFDDNKRTDTRNYQSYGPQGVDGGGIAELSTGCHANNEEEPLESNGDKHADEQGLNESKSSDVANVHGSNTMSGEQLFNSEQFSIPDVDFSVNKSDSEAIMSGQVASVSTSEIEKKSFYEEKSTLYEQINVDDGMLKLGMNKNHEQENNKLSNNEDEQKEAEDIKDECHTSLHCTDNLINKKELSECENGLHEQTNDYFNSKCTDSFVSTCTIPDDPDRTYINSDVLNVHVPSDEIFKDVEPVQITVKDVDVLDEDTRTKWQHIAVSTDSFAHQLCERLRMTLAPKKCSRFSGDYRTGRRLNMKRIVSYVASEFRKDRIWLRRTKPSERDYQILFAIDNSSSMIPLMKLVSETVATVSKAFQLLNVGKFGIISFGSCSRLLQPLHDSVLNDTVPEIMSNLNFTDEKTDFIEMLQFANAVFVSAPDSRQRLLLILSDGFLNVSHEFMAEHVQKLVNAGVFVALIIVDNANQSVFTMKRAVKEDGKMKIKPFLSEFPFPFYLVIRDVKQLPRTLSDALCQWFEFVDFI